MCAADRFLPGCVGRSVAWSSRARLALRECASAFDGRAGVRSVARPGPQLLRRPSGRVRRCDRECRDGRLVAAPGSTRLAAALFPIASALPVALLALLPWAPRGALLRSSTGYRQLATNRARRPPRGATRAYALRAPSRRRSVRRTSRARAPSACSDGSARRAQTHRSRRGQAASTRRGRDRVARAAAARDSRR